MAEVVSESEATNRNLIQLTEEAANSEQELCYLNKEACRILQDKTRQAVIVKKGIFLALWVDNAAERLSKIRFGG